MQAVKFRGFKLYCLTCEKVFHEMNQSIVYHKLDKLATPSWWRDALLHWRDTGHQILMDDPILGLMDFPKKCAEDLGISKQQLLDSLKRGTH